MSLTAVMALLAQGGAPNPKIPIPQRPLESHVVISSVEPCVLEQNDHFPMPPEVLAHTADPIVMRRLGSPKGHLKSSLKKEHVFVSFFDHFGAKKAPKMRPRSTKKRSRTGSGTMSAKVQIFDTILIFFEGPEP